MAGIFVDVKDDLAKLRELKDEIASVKKTLTDIDVRVNLDIKDNLEQQLKNLMGQYDAVVKRISDAEGKIMLSVQNINRATEQIVNAQKAVADAAVQPSAPQSYNQSQGQQKTAEANQQVTSSVQAQAKAYEELKVAIEDMSGTKNQNIVLMLRESEKLKSYKKELKELEKAPKTDETVEKIAQITGEVEKSKIVISDYRSSIKNDLKIEASVSGSMNELSQQLGKMRSVYRDLTEEERNSPFGKELLASIQQADAKIKELDASIGNHQRNVGNYASGFDSVRGKLNEFASSASAIPGPVGNIASSIQGMTKASLAFIATPLGLILAAISAALAAVSSWFHRTEEGENALNVATAVFSGTLNTLLDVVDNVGEYLYKAFSEAKNPIDFLRNAVVDLANFLKGQIINRLKAVAKGASAIMKILSGDLSGISEFNNAWIQGLTGIEDAGKKYDAFVAKSVNNAKERAKLAERQNVLDKKERENLVEKAKLEQKISELRAKGMDTSVSDKERAKATKEASRLTNKMYNDEIALAKEKYEIIRKTNALSHSNKADKEKEAQAEARLYQLETQRNNNQRMLTRQSNRVSAFQNQHAKKELNTANAVTNANARLDEIIRQNADDRKKLIVSLEDDISDARIKAMKDGAEKIQAERRRQNEKELEQIEEQRKAAIEKERERQKKEFEAEQNLIKAKGGRVTQWDEKMVDTSFLEQINKKYEKITEKTAEAQRNTLLKAEIAAMRDYLKEYGTYQQQKLAIAQEYAEKIAKAQTEGERLTLTKEKEKALQKKQDEQVISKVDWVAAFGNLGTAFEGVIRDVLTELNAYMQTDEFKSRDAEDKKTILDARNDLQGKLGNDATFENLNRQIEEYRGNVQSLNIAEAFHKTALDNLTAAEQSRDKIMDKSSKEYADASKKVADANAEVERTSDLVTDANSAVAEAQNNVADTAVKLQGNLDLFSGSLNQLASGTLSGTVNGLDGLVKSLGGTADVAGKFKDFLKTGLSAIFGEQLGGMMSESLDLVEGLLTGEMSEAIISGVLGMVDNILEGILKGGFITKPVNALVDGLGSIANTLTFGGFNSWFGASYDKWYDALEYWGGRLEVWGEAVDRYTDEISENYGAESYKAAEQAKYYNEQSIKGQEQLLDARLASGDSTFSHSMSYRMWQGSYKGEGGRRWKDVAGEISEKYGKPLNSMQDLYGYTADELREISAEYVDLWNAMDYKFREGLEDLIEMKDKAEEIRDTLNEALTGVSFDSFRDGMFSTLSDFSKGFDDLTDDFGNDLRTSILKSLLSKNFDERIKALYEQWTGIFDENGNVDESLVASAKETQEQLAKDMVNFRDTVTEAMGLDTSSSYQQQSSKKVYEGVSEDTANETNGRLTAVQINTDEIRRLSAERSVGITEIKGSLTGIGVYVSNIGNIADETRTILANSYLELQGINENTGTTAKYLKDIKADIAEVKRNTSRL